jgi:apolipoprotein N-acyltransferase
MIERIKKIFKHYQWPIISGLMVGTSYIPFPPWAILFCYLPLWYFALRKAENLKQVFWGGWWTQFVLTLIGFFWIAYTAHEFGFMPWIAAIPVLLLFAAAVHLYIPLSVTVGIYLKRRLQLSETATAFAFACLTSLGEQFWPSIFKWNLGYTLLWVRSPIAQWSDVVGFYGLSFGIFLINAWILAVFLNPTRLRIQKSAMLLLSAIALLIFGGIQRTQYWQETDRELNVMMVQANIGNSERIYAEKGMGFQQEIINRNTLLTQEGLAATPQSELIIWPESAFPSSLDEYLRGSNYPSQLFRFVQSIERPLITGAFSKDSPEIFPRRDYNALFLFDKNGQSLSPPYHKTQLLIFGEYLPFGEQFPWLAKYNPGGSGFGRGSGPMLMTLPGPKDTPEIHIGGQICYESLDPQFSSALARLGADVLINVTNDSWFGNYFEPDQHLFMTLARGLETRRPLIRSTNTGISSGILADGTVLEQSPLFKPWTGNYVVKFKENAPLTFYSQFGAFLSPLIFVILLGLLMMGRNRAGSVSTRLE